MTIKDIQPQTVRAHELYGDFWFNSDPVPISALRGQVILIDFWDYTCVNCLRTLPYIKEWYRKYSPHGLVVVGVHTPRFPFGRNPKNVERAIQQHGIAYPVVTDNEYLIAANYSSRFWPDLYLIDKNGFIRYQNSGEGNYGATEHVIQTLLYDAGVGEELPLAMEPIREEDKPGAVCYRATPELFAGYLRGSIGNVEGYSPESVIDYRDPKVYLDGRFYAEGSWMNDKNSLRLNEEAGREGQVIVDYRAVEVNAVIKPEVEKEFEVTVIQDDSFLTTENKGADVQLAGDGRSFIVINEARVFHLVRNKEFGEHILRLTTRSNSFALYSFTFLSCVIPELISNN
ncbi:MAG: redoxin domain-containing protein [Ignavibacteriae bacterium]|nr:redoxin domain-containing protein [Ignavibacteriota bacterium]